MSKYQLIYLIWLLPAYLLFLIIHQGAVFTSLADTYQNGSSYTADVVDYDMKQIAAQTNGYIVLRFETGNGELVRQRLSLPVEMAGQLTDIQVVPIRYQEDAFQSIVMMPTFSTQKGLILTNMAMAFVGLLIAVFVALSAHRYAARKLSEPEREFVIERIS